jgi:hypothetical protein
MAPWQWKPRCTPVRMAMVPSRIPYFISIVGSFTDCNEKTLKKNSVDLNPCKLTLLCSLLFRSALLGRMHLRRDSLFGIVTRQRGGRPRNRGSIPGRDARTNRPHRSGASYTSNGWPSEIWGTRIGVAEKWSRLGCDGVSTDKQLRTFCRVVTPCLQSLT